MTGVTVNKETVKEVQDSWEIVLQIPNCTQVVGELLFRNIFKLAPAGAHQMFPFGKDFDVVDDKMFKRRLFTQHAKHVVGMLDSSVHYLGVDLTELEGILVDLGSRHVGYGVLPEHYPIVGQALLETLATALGESIFTTNLKDAWAGVYGFITTSMLQGANESLLRLKLPLFGPPCIKQHPQEMTLDQYVSSMLPGQTDLYYITMANHDASDLVRFEKLQQARELQNAGVSILYIAKNKENLLAGNLQRYLGRNMVDVAGDHVVDTSFLQRHAANIQQAQDLSPSVAGLSQHVADDFCQWFQYTLGHDKVQACTPTCNYASQPARVIHDDENPNEPKHVETMTSLPLAKKHVEINPHHPLIVELNKAREQYPGLAQLLAAQIYDNCLIHAGIVVDCRTMVTRVNDLSLALLQEKNKSIVMVHNDNDNDKDSNTDKIPITATKDENSARSNWTQNTDLSHDQVSNNYEEGFIYEDDDDDDDDDDITVYSDVQGSQGFETGGSLGSFNVNDYWDENI